MGEGVDEVSVTSNITSVSSAEESAVIQTIQPTETQHVPVEQQTSRMQPSRRDVRVGESMNFCLYGITLMIPGISMIIVYFVVFRIPAGNIRWSPADAFVVTGAILVGFSIVSEVIGLWQFCVARNESSSNARGQSEMRNNQYSDEPPPYEGVAIDLPGLAIAGQLRSEEQPPTFESCYPNHRSLPGLGNWAFPCKDESEEYPPPPSYGGFDGKDTSAASSSDRSAIVHYDIANGARIKTTGT